MLKDRIKKLKKALEECTTMPIKVDVPLVKTVEVEKSKGNKQTAVADKFSIKDNHSKPVIPVSKTAGTKDAPKEFKANSDGVEIQNKVTPVARKPGTKDAPKEFKANSDGAEIQSSVEPVTRKPGTKDAPKKYLEEAFRTRVQYRLQQIKESLS